MMRKVERVLDPEIEAKGWEKIRSTVEVDLDTGTTLVEHADERYRGGPDLPFTREELHEKFSDCASLVLSPAGVEETFGMVERIEDLGDITELVRVLAAAGQPAGAAR
jgi:2-methylcitrate dehydratase PrpD